MTQLLDFAGSPPSPAAISAAGYAGVLRYLAPLPNSKCATRSEVDADLAGGLMVGLVWEAGARNALGGWAQGARDGTEAGRQALELGTPAGVCVYFAVDFDATPDMMPIIAAYMDAARDVVGRLQLRQGVYGSARVCDTMRADGHAALAWQTVAWSHGVHSGAAVLYQRAGQVTVGGTVCDVNDVLAPDWGGWGRAVPAPLPPVDKPTHYPGEKMTRIPVRVTTDGAGRGYRDMGLPVERVVSIVPGGDDPADGWGPHLLQPAYAIDSGGHARIVVPASGVVNGSVDLALWVADA